MRYPGYICGNEKVKQLVEHHNIKHAIAENSVRQLILDIIPKRCVQVFHREKWVDLGPGLIDITFVPLDLFRIRLNNGKVPRINIFEENAAEKLPPKVYSGDESEEFWDIINSLPDEQRQCAYSLGVALQNIEGDIRRLIQVQIDEAECTPEPREEK